MNGLLQSIQENVVFLLEFLLIVAVMVLIAYAAEKLHKKQKGEKERVLSTQKIAVIGMFSAVAAILHMLDFPVPFAPEFYKLDFGELPALVGAFAYGPVAGVMIEFCKIVLKLVFKGTSTAFVGDLANFVIGCAFLLPPSVLYLFVKGKKSAGLGCLLGTVCMTAFGGVFNAVYLLPKFAQLYGMPAEAIIEMGHIINPAIDSFATLALFAVVPLNLVKGGVISVITMLIYKKLSPILKKAKS